MKKESYSNEDSARDYRRYRLSPDGKYETDILFEMISPFLPENSNAPILDIGCGDGWLIRKLKLKYSDVSGCDISESLITIARKNDEGGNYVVADSDLALPYSENTFERVFSLMMLHDVSDLSATYKNIFSVLKRGGSLVVLVSNPYYSYPVGRWKRGVIGRLLFCKPSLLLAPYSQYVRSKRSFLWGGRVPSFFRTIPEYIQSALEVGFTLTEYYDVLVSRDSSTFNRQYQLYRFPMMVRLVFRKQ